MVKKMKLRLRDDLSDRLESLAIRMGRSKTSCAVEAIERHVQKYEDYFLAKDSLREFRDSSDDLVDLADLVGGARSCFEASDHNKDG
jgi:predicted DNA-binding protein